MTRRSPGYDKGAFPDEDPVHRVTVSDFRIDRDPVTMQQFKRFVDGGGYGDQTSWSSEGWRWREAWGQKQEDGEEKAKRERERTQPSAWDEQIRHPNRPVVNVTWHEAEAYCRWLAKKTDLNVRLPTEAQWEYGCIASSGAHCGRERRTRTGRPPESRGRARLGVQPSRWYG